MYSWFNPPYPPLPCTGCVSRYSQSIANWFIATFHVLAGRPHSAVMLRSASQINLVAASSLGKCPSAFLLRLHCSFD